MIRDRLAALLVLALMLGVGYLAGLQFTRPPVSTSTDGRWHTCGLVTDAGVTEHLAEYHARCGSQP